MFHSHRQAKRCLAAEGDPEKRSAAAQPGGSCIQSEPLPPPGSGEPRLAGGCITVASESAEAPMQRLVIVGAVLLLAGPAQAFWVDKRNVCATWSARQMSDREAAKKLGMKQDSSGGQIAVFCSYYKR